MFVDVVCPFGEMPGTVALSAPSVVVLTLHCSPSSAVMLAIPGFLHSLLLVRHFLCATLLAQIQLISLLLVGAIDPHLSRYHPLTSFLTPSIDWRVLKSVSASVSELRSLLRAESLGSTSLVRVTTLLPLHLSA